MQGCTLLGCNNIFDFWVRVYFQAFWGSQLWFTKQKWHSNQVQGASKLQRTLHIKRAFEDIFLTYAKIQAKYKVCFF